MKITATVTRHEPMKQPLPIAPSSARVHQIVRRIVAKGTAPLTRQWFARWTMLASETARASRAVSNAGDPFAFVLKSVLVDQCRATSNLQSTNGCADRAAANQSAISKTCDRRLRVQRLFVAVLHCTVARYAALASPLTRLAHRWATETAKTINAESKSEKNTLRANV